jgi:hypothetical protein
MWLILVSCWFTACALSKKGVGNFEWVGVLKLVYLEWW